MRVGRPTSTPTPTPTTTALGCTCPTTASTAPPAAPTIIFTSADSCPPQGAQASNSTTGAIYFSAQVQFEEPVQGSLTAADFAVGSVAAHSLVSNNTANCSCGTAVRREASPGKGLSHALLASCDCSVTQQYLSAFVWTIARTIARTTAMQRNQRLTAW